jgi:predicted small integral membrane protein
MLMLNMRMLKIVLVMLPALQMLQIGLNNAFNFSGVLRETGYVMGMTGATLVPDMMWRATENPVMIYAGSLFIVFAELLMACLLSFGAYQMWQARTLDKGSFNTAKRYVLWGCLCGLILFYGGFLVVAGNWFFLWATPAAGSLETAFRYATLIFLIMLFIAETNQD